MWDNNMKGQSNEADTDTLERISLEKHLKAAKEIEKKKKVGQ